MKKSINRWSALVLAGTFTLFTAASCGDGADGAKTDANSTKMGMQDSQDTAQKRNEMVMTEPQEDDASFVTKAAAANMAEVAAHKSAMAHGTNAEVKSTAKQMLADHEKMGEGMKKYAASKNITLPAEADNSDKAKLADLEKKTGADYDKDWVDMQVKAHNDVVDMFENNNGKRTDPELNKMIADNLPTLRMHRDMAKSLQDKMK